MSYLVDEFRKYFLGQGHKETSLNSYNVNLKKIDLALRDSEQIGLDEIISKDINWLQKWAKSSIGAPFDKETSNRRSALKKYLMFKESLGELLLEKPDTEFEEDNPLEPTGQAFHLERDMQAAVRRQIESLEIGLKIIDNNFERRVSTGEIDIIAKDKNDNFVVIELKAGDCPKGALEQLLGYANDIRIEEEVNRVRLFLIAKSFSDRIVGAATFIPDLRLVTYDYTLTFRTVE
jgi:Holliday junction resolvase-like predicted endonuclease